MMYQWSKKLAKYKVLTILTFRHIQCLHSMYAEVAWVLLSSGTQVRLQITPNPDHFPDYLSVFYEYDGAS